MDREDIEVFCAVGFCTALGLIIALVVYAAICLHFNVDEKTMNGAAYVPAILGAFGGGWFGATIMRFKP